MRRPKSKKVRKQFRQSEVEEIELLNQWIDAQKPDSGSSPLTLDPLPGKAPIGRINDKGVSGFSRYAGVRKFFQLPISKKTKDGLKDSKYINMTDIQIAALPHALCGRDVLGAAKTGSGKTLAFIIPVLEKLYRERWGPEDGVGCIIMSPTRELAGQIFEVLRVVGKLHSFSAGLLIGGRKGVDEEKERVNELNILICCPGRLLQHMDETPNFDCSRLQVLVLDEADHILDKGFEKAVNAIVSQLPKHRQTLLFSATQTKRVKDLARLSLEDPEYLGVHEKSVTATPDRLQQTAIEVPLDQKLDILWSFIKAHLNSKILVFLTTCKQAQFVFETFKKLRPGIPLKCLHGKMKQEKRAGIYSQFCQSRSVLFCTDVAARGLDFETKPIDWVVQVDCPEDVKTYIHRVGRTARYRFEGKSVLFLSPSEMEMLKKLEAEKIHVKLIKSINKKMMQPVSALLSALLVKYPNMQQLAQRAFITYMRSIYKQKDKEVFDVTKLPVDEFSASLGLPMVPKIKLLNRKDNKGKNSSEKTLLPELVMPVKVAETDLSKKDDLFPDELKEDLLDMDENELLQVKDSQSEKGGKEEKVGAIVPATRVLKKKKLKINIHRPTGSRVVFDEEGNSLPPLATLADMNSGDIPLDKDKKDEYYKKMRESMKQADKEDKLLDRERKREKRMKQKMKLKRAGMEEDDDSGSEEEAQRKPKRTKVYFDSDNEDVDAGEKKDDKGVKADAITLAEQEALALKLLSSMHS